MHKCIQPRPFLSIKMGCLRESKGRGDWLPTTVGWASHNILLTRDLTEEESGKNVDKTNVVATLFGFQVCLWPRHVGSLIIMTDPVYRSVGSRSDVCIL